MQMKRRRHVIGVQRTLGDVFAVEFKSRRFGYCRIIRDEAIEILAVFSRVAGMPDVDWSSKDIERWRASFLCDSRMALLDSRDDPVIIRVGNAPFANDEEADMPPTYRDPDNIEPRYTIEYQGVYRYTDDPADLEGIAKRIGLVPASLGSFLREKYIKGALREVEVKREVKRRLGQRIFIPGARKRGKDNLHESVARDSPSPPPEGGTSP